VRNSRCRPFPLHDVVSSQATTSAGDGSISLFPSSIGPGLWEFEPRPPRRAIRCVCRATIERAILQAILNLMLADVSRLRQCDDLRPVATGMDLDNLNNGLHGIAWLIRNLQATVTRIALAGCNAQWRALWRLFAVTYSPNRN